jgi:outer membrane protein TolC
VAKRVPLVKLGFGDAEQNDIVSPYIDRAQQLLDDDDDLGTQSVTEFPMNYQPWWTHQLNTPMRSRYVPMQVTFEEIILSALTHSPRVKALRIEPSIRHRSVAIERAQFDWLSFAEMNWDDTSDPVGNELTTGGSPRFRDNKWGFEHGLRRRTHSGGELEIANEIGWQDNNSTFFTPAPQGTSRLAVSFTQPLLRSRGKFFNKSRIVLAQIDTSVADSQSLLTIQEHLVEVSQAYWELFRSRASLLQKRKLLTRATVILERLEGRRGVDVLERQVLRARSAVASRRSEIARAAASVRNSESRLRLLVNDPTLLTGTPVELIPADQPLCDNMVYSTPETVTVGLMTRPDIAEAIREIRAQSVRLGVSKQEMLPRLDLILSSYLAGLQDDGDIWGAKRQWFQEGEPGYSIGLSFEYPLGNRAAKALVEQQQFRLRKAMFEFRNTVESGITEVELAVREARTSHTEMLSRFQAMRAAEAESIYLSERWQQLPGDDRTTAELLEDLLDAQERVATEEFAFETARMNYMLALIEIKRSTGTLLADDAGQSLLAQPTTLSGGAPPTHSMDQPAAPNFSGKTGAIIQGRPQAQFVQPGPYNNPPYAPPAYAPPAYAPPTPQPYNPQQAPIQGDAPLPPNPPR